MALVQASARAEKEALVEQLLADLRQILLDQGNIFLVEKDTDAGLWLFAYWPEGDLHKVAGAFSVPEYRLEDPDSTDQPLIVTPGG